MLIDAASWVKLENMPSERSETQKVIYCDSFYMKYTDV